LQVHDIRQTRVFQEAKEEGIEGERQRNLQEKLQFASKLVALNMAAEKIAEILGLDIEAVRNEIARTGP
jgi:predicted transposase YdaD